MINIMIFGGGYSAERYVESLIWNATYSVSLCGFGISHKTEALSSRYRLPLIRFSDLSQPVLNKFDCVILSVPVEKKLLLYRTITVELEFAGAIILEKPLCISRQDWNYYMDSNHIAQQFAVVCQRDYSLSKYQINPAKCYDLVFPSVFCDNRSRIIHDLPHIFSWFYSVLGCVPHIDQISSNCMYGQCDDSCFQVHFETWSFSSSVCINGVGYPPVQYRQLNAEIVRNVLLYTHVESLTNAHKALTVANALIILLE